jgi:hypothetical protein
MDRSSTEVDPDGVRSPHQRAKRAEWARKAHMQRLALKLAAARQRRKLICQRCGESKDADAFLQRRTRRRRAG